MFTELVIETYFLGQHDTLHPNPFVGFVMHRTQQAELFGLAIPLSHSPACAGNHHAHSRQDQVGLTCGADESDSLATVQDREYVLQNILGVIQVGSDSDGHSKISQDVWGNFTRRLLSRQVIFSFPYTSPSKSTVTIPG